MVVCLQADAYSLLLHLCSSFVLLFTLYLPFDDSDIAGRPCAVACAVPAGAVSELSFRSVQPSESKPENGTRPRRLPGTAGT
jgi:hypothetical protein